MSRTMLIKQNSHGVEAEQYGFFYLARRHGISCLEARAVLLAAGTSRQRSTYYADVLTALPMAPKGQPKARAEAFAAWVMMPLI